MRPIPDPFCPCHGRTSRPIEIPGLRCDCNANSVEKLTAKRLEPKPWTTTAKHHLDLVRALLAPLDPLDQAAVMVELAAEAHCGVRRAYPSFSPLDAARVLLGLEGEG